MSKLGIGDKLKRAVEENDAYSAFKYFEPWDVAERSDEIYELAKKDDVDLFCDDYVRTGNIGAHPFQSGFLLSSKKIRALIGPTRGGKSLPALIEIGIMCSGECPIALQYNKGVDTGIERLITKLNIRRWGRYDKATGEFLDHDVDADRDGTWNCGNIVGVGKYPKEKIVPKVLVEEDIDRVIWIGTKSTTIDDSWWPKITRGVSFPEKFIDRTKGNNGTLQSNGKHFIYLVNDIILSIRSYETSFTAFEGITAWACFFDEEATDMACYNAAISHCKYFSAQMTPYNGLTYTRETFFTPDPRIDLFHSTAYDSPYITIEDIELYKRQYPAHEIKARIWGEHSSESKQPYYDVQKLRAWIKKLKDEQNYHRAEFVPSVDYFGIKRAPLSQMPGLMEIEVTMLAVENDDEGKNDDGHNLAWNIFEEREAGVAYFIPSDAANGADVPENALDFQAATVFRAPKEGELYPVPVANIETTCKPDVFAKIVGLALNYYNWALLCSESARVGAANGMFYSEMQDYPHWLETTTRRSGTNTYITGKGLDNKAGTRKDIFDGVGKVFGSYMSYELPPIPCVKTLEQALECQKVIKNGSFRPDHPKNKPNDLLMTYAMGLFVWKHYSNQIKCRRIPDKKLAIAPRDSLMGMLERSKKKQNMNTSFPNNRGVARR
jgi:hypothetical protein